MSISPCCVLLPSPARSPRSQGSSTSKIRRSCTIRRSCKSPTLYISPLNLLAHSDGLQPLLAGHTPNTTQNSAALAGMAAGPFFFAPISYRLGRSSVIFWCALFTLACQIWGAVMTNPDDYIPYIMSRLFSGFFGAVPTVLGPRIVTDLFFLHQRGRAFTALHMAFLFGTIAGPTFSGFISAGAYFPVEFWWTVGLLGFTIICCFLFLEETGFDRNRLKNNPDIPRGLVANRFATFFLWQRVVQPTTWRETVTSPPNALNRLT